MDLWLRANGSQIIWISAFLLLQSSAVTLGKSIMLTSWTEWLWDPEKKDLTEVQCIINFEESDSLSFTE